MLNEFADVITDGVPPGLTPERFLADGRKLEHRIPMKPGARPKAQQPYKISATEGAALLRALHKLSGKEWIRPSLSPYGSPLLLQRKKNGDLRICVDYRAVNHDTIKYAYPMPRIEELLAKVHGFSVVSKLDLSEGFHQIRIHPDDVCKTAFVTPYGAYEYLVMPIGLANAPAQFTLPMNSVFCDLTCCVVFMVDSLVFSKTLEDHHKDLRSVLQRLRDNTLYAAPKKCELYRTSVEYLGHVISPQGSTVVPAKANAVKEWPTLKNLKEL